MAPELEKGLKTALAMLRAGDKFREEIRRRLAEGGHSPETIASVFEWLGQKRLCDDARTLDNALERMRAIGWGEAKIRGSLLARGVDEGLLEERLSAGDSEPETVAAMRVLATRPNLDRHQAGRFLTSRGFGEDAIESALAERFGDSD